MRSFLVPDWTDVVLNRPLVIICTLKGQVYPCRVGEKKKRDIGPRRKKEAYRTHHAGWSTLLAKIEPVHSLIP